MPLIATRGAASAQGFGEFGAVAGPAPAVYIEDVFSTYLYTGNGSTQTITNGIDLAGEGGLVWIKDRSAAIDHIVFDTVRGATKGINTNLTDAQGNYTNALTAFTSSGFSLGSPSTYVNTNGDTYASWTFRKQAKFFDVVTYTGNGANRTISHNLGSVPGCIIVKRTDTTGDWQVYHRSSGNTKYLVLNSTAAEATSSTRWNDTTPTSTVFSVGTESTVNANGGTYVAYLFAHDAGGFGLTGTDNVISCGSYTGTGATGLSVSLGYEPQWLLVKRASGGTASWTLVDNMRGFTVGNDVFLYPDSSAAEVAGANYFNPTATGFTVETTSVNANGSGDTYIYIAIRRGPMRVPTSGTEVYNALTRTGTSAAVNITGVGFPPDLVANKGRSASGLDNLWTDRLRGATKYLVTNSTNAEATNAQMVTALGQDGVSWGNDDGNFSPYTYVNWFFRRAPGFFDVVCYTGNGTNLAINHNLQAVPELIILKYRAGTSYGWKVTATGLTNPNTYYLDLNGTNAESNYTANFIYNRTSTTFTVVSDLAQSGWNWVAYLFATCAGVSKVGSYTGTGTTQQINCGFTGGARFVLIKRTDSTGDWYVWDSARGIVAGNDPYLLLNSTAAEVTNTDYVDTYSAGFEISSTAPADINANSGTFIFLAIA